MKIALAFFGITRSLRYTIKSIKQNILSQLSGHRVDIFMHTFSLSHYRNKRTNETTSFYNNKEHKLLNPKYFKIEDQDTVKKQLNLLKYRTHKDPWGTNYNSVDNFILAQYSKCELVKMIENVGDYDYIIFIRPDCVYLSPLKIEYLTKANSSTIVTPNFHLSGPFFFNDRFAITTKDTYKRYGNLFYYLLVISKIEPLHSETVMGKYMSCYKNITIPFIFVRVRIDGKIPEYDKELIKNIENTKLAFPNR